MLGVIRIASRPIDLGHDGLFVLYFAFRMHHFLFSGIYKFVSSFLFIHITSFRAGHRTSIDFAFTCST